MKKQKMTETTKFKSKEPPENLSQEAQELYHLHVGKGEIQTPAAVASFIGGLQAFDLANKALLELNNGLTTTSKRSGMERASQQWQIYQGAMKLWLKTCKELSLSRNTTLRDGGLGYTTAFEITTGEKG